MPVVVADRSRRWLTTVALITPHNAEQRIERLTRQIEELAPEWSMAPVATAIQAMRGVALINAVTVVAEVGDFARFGNLAN